MTRPRSIVRVCPSSATRTASSTSLGIPNVRTKSQPVPRGMSATVGGSSTREAVHDLVDRAVAADDDEQLGAAVRRLAGELAELPAALGDERVAFEAARGRLVRDLRPAPPVEPLADAGLTRKTVVAPRASRSGGHGVERELGHLVDRLPHVLVRDAEELALDDRRR